MRFLTICLLLAAGAPALEAGWRQAERLAERAERPAGIDAARPPHLEGLVPGVALFTMTGTDNGAVIRPIADVTGDGYDDVVAGSFDTHVYALSGRNGVPFWSYATGNRVFSVHALGDLNGDGVPEVGTATQDTTSSTVAFVLDGDAGAHLPLFADDFENGAAVGWAEIAP